MFDHPDIQAALQEAARRNGADAAALRAAVEHESAAELAGALQLPPAEAQQRMDRLQRVLLVSGDWGAGCRLLTDDVRGELLAILDAW